MSSRVYEPLKSLLDALVATVALVVLAPVFALASIATLVDSGWPLLFRQVRAGRFGKPFVIYKFRTMRAETPVIDAPLSEDDPGITRVGRILRATSVDELPQFINVMKGEMSLIGPRPTVPSQAERYDAHQRRRLLVRPGITGWAQVNGRNTVSWDERIELDCWYVDHRCLALDLKIAWRTLGVLLRPALSWAARKGPEEVIE